MTACTAPHKPAATSPPTSPPRAEAIDKIVRDTIAQAHLKAVLVRVTVDDKDVLTRAFGESMTGVPATTAMHFRNGAVAISYVATLLLRLVDEKKVNLDDKLAKWLPDVPNSERVTLGQLAQMTSGYADYVIGNEPMNAELYRDPFRQWTPQQLLAYAIDKPLLYEPGTNWNYSHTSYVLLGLALEKATGQDMPTLLSQQVLDPLGLTNTADSFTPEIPTPALHAFTSERRQALHIPSGTTFYEESTFWNPSWTITHGAIQTTDIHDLAATAEGIGSGRLLSADSYRRMISTNLRGKTTALPGCPTCGVQDDFYTYGLGIVISGKWLLQNPLFSGYAALEAYLPDRRIAIAVAVTYDQDAFDSEGEYTNEADALFRKIGAEVAPDDAPPVRPPK
ncbi:serine hydrolase [Mycobacterium sp. CVI_P3]|uniref:Serine hydrolase n=1 Tax=Mycobacterium pinniadriaticum TaxID=2994102 RepID=A0ABT3SJS8_9MYCO|nr:serine hydrolase domain-containing protein [Mycobacterium pinniadriaticum]MCX2933359.1 serine hydrolase [Mycobacterium pinniadriaticum]MCX2939781.1 serine hydrolase [Mycobacterium pinniadriaticum]